MTKQQEIKWDKRKQKQTRMNHITKISSHLVSGLFAIKNKLMSNVKMFFILQNTKSVVWLRKSTKLVLKFYNLE